MKRGIMKRGIITFNDGTYINLPADRIEKSNGCITLYNRDNIAAVVKLESVVSVCVSEKNTENP